MGIFGKLFGKKNKQRSQGQTEAPLLPPTQEQPPEDARGNEAAEAAKANPPAAASPATPVKEVKETGKAPVKEAKVTAKAPAKEAKETGKAPAKEAKETGKAPTKEAKETGKVPAKEAKETGKAPAKEAKETGKAPVKEAKETAKTKETKATDTKAADAKEAKKTSPKTSAPEKPGKPEEAGEGQESATEKAPAAGVGRFEIKKSKDGRYVFNLYASNHVIVATSQVYSSAQNARIGINSVIANAAVAGVEDQTRRDSTPLPYPKWELYQDNGGKYRFRLLATNASCVCHSQGYTSKANCKKGIESIIRTAGSATIDKAYLKKE